MCACLALQVLVGLGQEVLSPAVVGQGDIETSVGVFPQVVGVALVRTVDLGRVDERRVLVQLLPGTCRWKARPAWSLSSTSSVSKK